MLRYLILYQSNYCLGSGLYLLPKVSREDFGNVMPGEMAGRPCRMRWHITAKLDYSVPDIGLDNLDASRFQRSSQTDFLSQVRFHFAHHFLIPTLTDHQCYRLRFAIRPVYLD